MLRAGTEHRWAPRIARVPAPLRGGRPSAHSATMPPKSARAKTPEHRRLEEARTGAAPWKAWGPYLSERQWGTVREDYSPGGDAWNYFPHDQARSRAYRWGEDGIAGICDERQRLCLALALWNGADPILKERMFGLTNSEGNHGEDVKEYWFYLDSTPTHSYLKCQYKYPQRAFPYLDLVSTNARRGKQDMEYELLDTGIFDEDRYFDVIVEYAKAAHDDILMLVTAYNRGPDAATLHLLPTLWFRNTWSWGDEVTEADADGRRRGARDRCRARVPRRNWASGCCAPTRRRSCCSARTRPTTSACSGRPMLRRMSRTRSTSSSSPAPPTRSTRSARARRSPPITCWRSPRGERSIRVRLTASADGCRDATRGRGQAAGARNSIACSSAARGGRRVLCDGDPPDAASGRGDGDAPGARRAAVGQAVLRVRRAPLAARARSRPVGSECGCQLGAQRAVVPHGRGRRDLDAGQVGVSVVRRVGPGVSLRAAVAGRRRLRQGSRSSCCSAPGICTPTARSRPTSGTSATSTRR